MGKIVFQKPIESQTDSVLNYDQGLMVHIYVQGGQIIIDQRAYLWKNSGTEIKYVSITDKPF